MTNLPTVFNEAAAIDLVSTWVEIVKEKLTAESSRQFLEAGLVYLLRRDAVDELQIIKDADAGDEIADAALCKVYEQKVNHREEATIHLTSYVLKTLRRRGPMQRGRGGVWYDGWRRKYSILCLVFLTVRRFNLAPTRNREQRRRKQPSASSIVAAALGRHRINVTEKTVENLWGALQGHIGVYILNQLNLSPHQIP
jgi:hypothetical protein